MHCRSYCLNLILLVSVIKVQATCRIQALSMLSVTLEKKQRLHWQVPRRPDIALAVVIGAPHQSQRPWTAGSCALSGPSIENLI